MPITLNGSPIRRNNTKEYRNEQNNIRNSYREPNKSTATKACLNLATPRFSQCYLELISPLLVLCHEELLKDLEHILFHYHQSLPDTVISLLVIQVIIYSKEVSKRVRLKMKIVSTNCHFYTACGKNIINSFLSGRWNTKSEILMDKWIPH